MLITDYEIKLEATTDRIEYIGKLKETKFCKLHWCGGNNGVKFLEQELEKWEELVE